LIEIGLLVLEKRFFPKINTYKYGFPHCGPTSISGSFGVNLSFSGFVVCEKKVFEWPNPIFAFL
jgi:hypothetical protein